jgi:hypothetical protein
MLFDITIIAPYVGRVIFAAPALAASKKFEPPATFRETSSSVL